jgi:membrane-associated protein
MPYRRFASFNIIGGVSWVLSMTVIGYFLGQFEFVTHHLEKVIILVVVISVMPGVIAWLRNRNASKSATQS